MPQNFKVKLDTLNFGYKEGPYLTVPQNSFDEVLISKYLGIDKSESFPLKKGNKNFELNLTLRKPQFILIVNAEILAIPNQEVNGIIDNTEFINIRDSNNINYFFINLNKRITSFRVRINKDMRQREFLLLYDSMKTLIYDQLKFISQPENRKKYNIDFGVISYLRHYFMAELGNFLYYSTWFKRDFDTETYKYCLKDITITDPKILLETKYGTSFLQQHFFYYALPANNYDLKKTLSSDSFFRTNEVKKYLGYRYFSHLYADKNILAKIKDFDTAFSVFKNSYSFTNEQKLSLEKLEYRVRESKYAILSSVLGEDIMKPGGSTISINDKSEAFGGDKLLYIWASWCLPCRQYLNELKSNNFMYKGKTYTMTFLSIDTDLNKWEKVQYPIFNSLNSFKVGYPDKSKLVKNYELDKVVPRVLLLQAGMVVELSIEKSQLIQK